jgi:MFS transporter, putative signal transducer
MTDARFIDPAGRLSFGRIMLTIGGIYVAQTLVSALAFQALPAVLRANGVSLDMIALMSVAMLPWALKFLWAPAIERYRIPVSGARRSRQIIVVGQFAVGLTLAVLSTLMPTSVGPLLLVFGLASTIAATIDIACDGFAIEQLRAADRGWGNVAQVGGSYVGAMLGGGLSLVLVTRFGWNVAMLAMAGFVLVLALPFAFTREPSRQSLAESGHRPSLGYALARPEIRLGLMMTVIFDAGARLAMSVAGPFLVDAGVDLALLGWASGIGGAVAGVIGTLLGGGIVRACGTRLAVIVAAALYTVPLAALASMAWAGTHRTEWLIAVLLLHAGSMAIGYVALYSHLMGLASLRQAGVDFTLFQCANAAVAAVVGFAGNMVAQHLGYVGSFAGALAMALATLVFVPVLLRKLPTRTEAVVV